MVEENQTINVLLDLPTELLVLVLQPLTTRDLSRIRAVCHTMASEQDGQKSLVEIALLSRAMARNDTYATGTYAAGKLTRSMSPVQWLLCLDRCAESEGETIWDAAQILLHIPLPHFPAQVAESFRCSLRQRRCITRCISANDNSIQVCQFYELPGNTSSLNYVPHEPRLLTKAQRRHARERRARNEPRIVCSVLYDQLKNGIRISIDRHSKITIVAKYVTYRDQGFFFCDDDLLKKLLLKITREIWSINLLNTNIS